MKSKICQQCGSDDRVRKVARKNLYWCWECRSERALYSTIEEAREVFSRRQQNPKTVVSLDFNSLYNEFSNDCKTFEEIAKSQSVTRDRIRQLYMKYFSRFIPRRPDGMTRRKVCTLKRKALNKTERFFKNPGASALKSAVESIGLEINVIQVQHHLFSIGGKRCVFYFCSKARQFEAKKKFYWYFRFYPQTLKRSELVILLLVDKGEFRFFIIPVLKLPARFFEILKNLYVPQEGYDSKGRGRGSDFFDVLKYENAWYYLDEKKSLEPQVNLTESPA